MIDSVGYEYVLPGGTVGGATHIDLADLPCVQGAMTLGFAQAGKT